MAMKYRALSTVMVPVGTVIKPTAKQLARLTGLVKQIDKRKGWVATLAEIHVKAGEEFEADAEFSGSNVELLEQPAPAPSPAPSQSPSQSPSS